MNKIHGSGELPFTTGNAALAFCLYIAGIPFQDDDQPLTNTYSAEILHKLGYEKTPIEEAVKLAFAAGKKGHIEYGFKRALRIGEAMQGFKDAEKTIKDSETNCAVLVQDFIRGHARGLLSLPEALSAASAVTLKRWRDELKHWEQNRKFSHQVNRNLVQHHDARELAEKMFMAGEPFAFMAVILDARAVFLKLPERYPPIIRLRRAGSTSTRDEGKRKVARHPGFAFYTPDTENSIRKDLRVPLK
jgi:hypothetical protein